MKREIFEESDREDEVRRKGKALKDKYYKDDRGDMGDIAEKAGRMTIRKRVPFKRHDEFSWERHGLWTNEQKARAVRLEKQLKARWVLEDVIEQQLKSFQAHYRRAMIPTRLNDVSQLLMPRATPTHELAALTWFGDWRPSAILDLLHSLSSSLSDPILLEKVLPRLVKEIRIDEAVIDEEIAEIQATCILNLPFGPIKRKRSGPALDSVQAEFQKIHSVISKAQNLRLKALELVVKKVLTQTAAAEFLVAFAGIQDSIHQFTTQHRLQKGPVSQPFKALQGCI